MEDEDSKLWFDYKIKARDLLEYTSNLPQELQDKARNHLKLRLDLPSISDCEKLPATGEEHEEGQIPKRRGRPPGSRNKESQPQSVNMSIELSASMKDPASIPSTSVQTRPVRSTPSRYRVMRDPAVKSNSEVSQNDSPVEEDCIIEERKELEGRTEHETPMGNSENSEERTGYCIMEDLNNSLITGITVSLPKVAVPEFTRSWKKRCKTAVNPQNEQMETFGDNDNIKIKVEEASVLSEFITPLEDSLCEDNIGVDHIEPVTPNTPSVVVDVSDLVNNVTLDVEESSIDLSSAQLIAIKPDEEFMDKDYIEELDDNYPLAKKAKLEVEEQSKSKDQVVIVISKKPIDNLLEGDASNQTLPGDVAETLTAAVAKDPKNSGAEKIVYLVDASSYRKQFDKPNEPRTKQPRKERAIKVENGVAEEVGSDEEIVPLRKRRPKRNLYFSDEKIHSACHMCPECNQIWPTRDSLRDHLQKKHKGSYKCEVCGRKFAYKHIHDNHMACHENGDFHKCPQCANMIQGKDRLEEHIRQRHENRIGVNKEYHRCTFCEQSFRSHKLRREHVKAEHHEEKATIHCPMCSRRFFYETAFREHEKEHETGLLIKCPRDGCSYHYKAEQELEIHISRIHDRNAPRPHLCHVCCKAFTEARYLKTHMASHKRGKKFVCDSCMFETFSIQQLKLHLVNKHSMTLAHVCDICGAKLTSKGGLQDHLKRHYNQKDAFCPICGKGFVSKSQVAAHKKIHEPRQFSCTECNRMFVTKHKLAEHVITHTDERKFQCLHEHCSYRTSQKSNLYKHMERIHKMKHPEKYINYRYVQKVKMAKDHDVNEVTIESGDSGWIGKPGGLVGAGTLIGIPQTVQEDDEILQDDTKSVLSMIESRESAFTDQAEAAEVLAQMQSTPVIVRTPSGQPQYHVITYLPDHYTIHDNFIKSKTDGSEHLNDNLLEEQAIQVENVENIIHLPENTDDAPVSYMLQINGDQQEMITLSAEDLGIGNDDGEGKYIAVESGTVLIDNAGNILKVVE